MSEKKPKRPVGRPSKYTPEMVELICERVATHECGLTRLTELYDDIPDRVTINIWRRKYPEFRSKYAQAKCEQLEFITEDILEIADDASNDWMEFYDKQNDCAGWKVNGEHIQRSRLRIDARKWLACKLVPKVYGELVKEQSNPQDTLSKVRELVDGYNKTNTSDI